MGQRNATYVIVEHGKNKSIMPIYNQWNYVEIQAPKMVRGIKAVKKFDWKYNRMNIIPAVYFANAGDNTHSKKQKSEWVGGIDETKEYGKGGCYTGGFQEDNNNGWNIVKFIIDDKGECRVEIFCKVGSEDEDRASSKDVESYFFEPENIIEDIKYLKTLLWNPELENEADTLLHELHLNSNKSSNSPLMY